MYESYATARKSVQLTEEQQQWLDATQTEKSKKSLQPPTNTAVTNKKDGKGAKPSSDNKTKEIAKGNTTRPTSKDGVVTIKPAATKVTSPSKSASAPGGGAKSSNTCNGTKKSVIEDPPPVLTASEKALDFMKIQFPSATGPYTTTLVTTPYPVVPELDEPNTQAILECNKVTKLFNQHHLTLAPSTIYRALTIPLDLPEPVSLELLALSQPSARLMLNPMPEKLWRTSKKLAVSSKGKKKKKKKTT